jgi:hypothetical protein
MKYILNIILNAMIDLTRILKVDDVIYCTLLGEYCTVRLIEFKYDYPIMIEGSTTISLTKDGKFFNSTNAECIIWPDEDARTWENYKKYILGDIVYLYNSNSIAVIKEKEPNDYYRSFFVYRLNSKTFSTNQLIGPSRKATKEEIEGMYDEMNKQGIYFDYVTCKFEKLPKPKDNTFVTVVNPQTVYWFIIPKDLDHQTMLMSKWKTLSKVFSKTINFKDKPSCIGHIVFNFNDAPQIVSYHSEIAKVIRMFGKELKINS